MPMIAYGYNEANGVLRFIIKSQKKWYNKFWGINKGVARDLGAQ